LLDYVGESSLSAPHKWHNIPLAEVNDLQNKLPSFGLLLLGVVRRIARIYYCNYKYVEVRDHEQKNTKNMSFQDERPNLSADAWPHQLAGRINGAVSSE